ncbi:MOLYBDOPTERIN COFACTOR SULFURASE MOSC [Salix koriyanagi]|uniref:MOLYBDOPTERIN COFACTOR SULFURASE MOSC n=1 Tax=Salix koriyanagi TaxID=2511006 RepID=A0A9Q0Q9A4_9ROSI|nr:MOLYBDOPTERIN COFACTOR SULFURASE MOSC [Salix koriyanagi]
MDLRWSGPITQSEMQYVYDNLCKNEESSRTTPDSKPGYPKRLGAGEPTPFIHSRSDIDETQLKASRLLDILNKKTTFQGNFISTPEIQAQNRALKHCGLSEADYLGYFQR